MKQPPSRKRVEKMRQREAQVGLEADDEAAKWLAENDAPPPTDEPKAARKSKLLHQYRNRKDRP